MSKTTPILFAVAAAVLSGCSSPGYFYELRVAPSADLDLANEAAWSWTSATGSTGSRPVEFRVVGTPFGCSDQDCIFLEEVAPADVGFSDVDVTSTCPKGILGCTLTMSDTQTSHTKISTSLDSRPAERLAAYAHELGHALGLSYEEGHVLMNCPKLDQGIEGPTPDDVTQFYAVRGVGRPGFVK